MHRRHVHFDAEKVEELKRSDPQWRDFFDREAAEIAEKVKKAGGWDAFMAEQQRQLA